MSAGGNVVLTVGGQGAESKEKECIAALFKGTTNPLDDREKLKTFKGRVVSAVCEWIHVNPSFKSWQDDTNRSQLLWISGSAGKGKTILSLYLIDQLESNPAYRENTVVLYYFCDSSDDKRNSGSSVLRGLMFLLLKARPGLVTLLLSDYEIQKDALFSSLEALWRIFESMTTDPGVGQVYCIIDGLDECKQDSLWHLLQKIKNFYEDERERCPRRTPLSAISQKPMVGMKMILVSREAPTCLPDTLSSFPRVHIGVAAKGKVSPVKTVKETKLAVSAKEVLRKQTLGVTSQGYLELPGTSGGNTSYVQGSASQHTITHSPPVHSPPSPSPNLFVISTPSTSAHSPTSAMSTFTGQYQSFHPINAQQSPMPPTTEYVFDEVEDSAEDEMGDHFNEEESVPHEPLVLFVESKVAELWAERGYSDKSYDEVVCSLQEKGDGSFLWVDLAIEELKRVQPQYIAHVVSDLPVGLDEMYCRALRRIPSHLDDVVVAIMRWVIVARRPLYLEELGFAISLMTSSSFDCIDRTRQGIAACSTMVAIHEDGQVQITHASVKDLLTAKSGLLWSDPGLFRFHVNVEEVNGEIASFCLSYLEQGCLQEGPVSHVENATLYNMRITQYNLLPYAVLFWAEHLRSASRPQINLSSPFFMKKSKIRKNWWLTYWPATTGKATFIAPRNFNMLHMAAYLNVPYIADQLLLRGEIRSRLDERDSHSKTPLAYAAEMGNMSMFVLLLRYGARQEFVDESVFELACCKGQHDIAEYLLQSGYNANTQARVVGAFEAIGVTVRYLPGVLNEGIQLDGDKWRLLLRDIGERGTPLHAASLYGHVALVKLLLRWNANIHAATTRGWTALHAASWTGQVECIKILLRHGANAFEVTEFGWIPFHCAASRGKTSAIRLIVEHGLLVNILTTKQKSALHLAAYSGFVDTVWLLVELGCPLDAQSHKGETPLHLATRAGKGQVVEALLSLGANRLIVNNNGYNAADSVRLLKSKKKPFGFWRPLERQDV